MANKRAEPESDDDFDQDERSKRSRVEEEEDGGLARLTEEQQRLEAAKRATIRANAGPRKVVASKDGDLLGVIKKVDIHDFMCHKRLSFDFNPQINFIIGHNGSGKSAVLTAITVALGGKTASTGRAAGVKDLVRTGADRAKIILTLLNGGPDAHRPDVYGDEITIERTIMREGASTWKIRGKKHGQKEISKKREELTNICQAMSIQIDNPLTVLTQDQSRNFLASSDPAKKYDLFLRGTGLQDLLDQYEATRRSNDATENSIKALRERLPDRERECKKWEDLHNSMQAIVRNKEKLHALNNELAWSYVRDKATEKERIQADVDKQSEKLLRLKIKIKETDEQIKEAEAAVVVCEKNKADFIDGHAHLEDESKANHQAREEAMRNIREIDKNIQERNAIINKHTMDINTYTEARAKEIEKSGNSRLDEERRGHETKIKGLTDLLEKINREQLVCSETRADKVKQRDDLKNDIANVDGAKAGLQSQLTVLQRRAEATQQQIGGRDPLGRYGQNLQAVKQEIGKRTWKRGPPIGPLGMFVKLKPGEDRYKTLLTGLLVNVLVSWGVQDPADRKQLLDIFRLCVRQRGTNFDLGYNSHREAIPSIITYANDVFDYSSGDLRHIHETVMSKLEFTDPRVERIVVNQASAEKLFLAQSRRDADELIDSKMRNLRTATFNTLDNFQVRKLNSGGKSSSTSSIYRGTPFLGTDLQAELDALREEYKRVDSELRASVQAREELVARMSALTRDIQQLDDRAKKLLMGKKNAEKQREAAKLELEQTEPADIAVFTESIEASEQARLAEVNQLTGLHVSLEEAKEEFNKVKVAREDLKRRKDDFLAENQALDAAIERATQERMRKQGNKQHWVEQLKKQSDVARRAEIELENVKLDLVDWTGKAKQFCDEVEVTHETQDLFRRKKATEKALEQQKKASGVNLDEVLQRLAGAKKEVDKTKKNIKGLEMLRQSFEESLKDRRRTWHNLRAQISTITKTQFLANLSKRGFQGELTLDHEAGHLTLKVQTESKTGKDADADAGASRSAKNLHKDPKALSGGETSFSTICLLMALWDSVHSPIRCLDEFDVFMDATNRQLSMAMLIENAKNKRGHQHILITPQDMNNVQLGPEVKACRMPDPERSGASQGRLPFSAVN